MKIKEIINMPNQNFNKSALGDRIKQSTYAMPFDDTFDVYYIMTSQHTNMFLLDKQKQTALYSAFVGSLDDELWQIKNVQVYEPYNGRNLAIEFYKFITNTLGKSILSDDEQTSAAKKMWIERMPKYGLTPGIYDTQSNSVINANSDEYKSALKQLYHDDSTHPNAKRYRWILQPQS